MSPTRRRLLVGLGALNVGLGTIGIFVPGLPTTVFLLVASFCFARSSPRLHQRLHAHRRLGAYLRAAEDRAMPLHAKIVSLVGMWGGIGATVVMLGDAAWPRAIVVALGAIGTIVIVRLRSARNPGLEGGCPVIPDAATRRAVARVE